MEEDVQFVDALRKAAQMPHKKKGAEVSVSKMDIIAENLTDLAVGASDDKVKLAAIKEMGDRLSGKAKQATDITSGGEKILFLPPELMAKYGIEQSGNV